MTPASVKTVKNAYVLPCRPTQEPVLSKGSYWEAGGKVSAVSSGAVIHVDYLAMRSKWVLSEFRCQ